MTISADVTIVSRLDAFKRGPFRKRGLTLPEDELEALRLACSEEDKPRLRDSRPWSWW
jgi:hypothetical protein